MDKIKAGDIIEKLVLLDYFPTITKIGEDDYRLDVASSKGVLINTLKTFQDNNNVIVKVRVVEIT